MFSLVFLCAYSFIVPLPYTLLYSHLFWLSWLIYSASSVLCLGIGILLCIFFSLCFISAYFSIRALQFPSLPYLLCALYLLSILRDRASITLSTSILLFFFSAFLLFLSALCKVKVIIF